MNYKITFNQSTEKYMNNIRKKDYYKWAINKILKYKINSVLDVGSASGDFLSFLPKNINGTGIDKNKMLTKKAIINNKLKDNLRFLNYDFFKFNQKNECITIFGTLITFPDFKKVLTKCIKMKPKLILINDAFNIDGIDIKLGYKFSNKQKNNFNFAFNIVSLESISNFLIEKKLKFKFTKYKIKKKLQKSNNQIYSYHANLNNKTVITNGTGIVMHLYNLEIIL